MRVLSIDGVSHRYGATHALHDVSLQIAAGSIHALIGENGAGKSTLVKTMSGALQTDAGSMTLRDETFAPSAPSQARNAGVATVYQELSLAPHLTVAESLFLGREPTRFGWLDTSTIEAAGTIALARLDRTDIPLDARILDLSIADRQIVEIARALHGRADLLILDEPTSSLTGEDASQLFDVLRRLRDEGLAILYISHFLEEIIDLTDRYTVLRDGEVTGHGATSDIDATRLATLMVGRPLQKRTARDHTISDDALLHVDAIHGSPLPIDASIELHRGEILGIGGLVGSGRSELVRAIFGLDPVTSGSVRILDVSGPSTPAACLDAGLGLLSEDRSREGLALNLSVADNLVMSRWPTRRRGWLDLLERDRSTNHWIDELGIRTPSTGMHVGSLSGGNQQKVALARLLHHDVDVLLLDEPTRGIDIASKETIYACIEKLAEAGKAILVTSSHLPELLSVCDRIAMMHRGKLGPFQPATQRDEHEMILEATLGDQADDRSAEAP